MSAEADVTDRSGDDHSTSALAATAEHRQWIRTALPNARATLTWHVSGTEVTHDAVLVDISGGGAAIHLAAWPPGERAVWLNLIHDGVVSVPIEASLIEGRLIAPGKILCRLRFVSSAPLEGVIPLHKECRMWKRFPARETHAELEWQDGAQTDRVAVALMNISGGGAAVQSEAAPPSDRPFWLSVRVGGFQSSRVLCRLVEYSSHRSNQAVARLEFEEGCPLDLFEVAVHGL